jgi:hypothetical protein
MVQEAGQGDGGNVDNIFDVTLMRAPGNRYKLNAERDRHRKEVEELGVDINLLATELRQREEELESLRANTSSYIGNLLVQEAGQGGGGKFNDIFDIFDAMLMQAAGNKNKLNTERDRHREEVEELGGGGVNMLATKLRQREEELESLRANVSGYNSNILMQESGQGGGGNVNDIFDATLMQAAGNRNKLNAERDRHREEVEELGGDVNVLATKLRQREEELELLRIDTNSYIGNILVQEAGQGGSSNIDDIFDATLMQAAGNRNKLNAERDRHREEVEELGGGVNLLAMKLRLREEELELLRANVSNYIGNLLVQEAWQGSSGGVNNIFDAMLMQAAGDRNELNVERDGKDVTKELEEGAVGVEAKEESSELPVGGANANKETWVFLGEPAVGGAK